MTKRVQGTTGVSFAVQVECTQTVWWFPKRLGRSETHHSVWFLASASVCDCFLPINQQFYTLEDPSSRCLTFLSLPSELLEYWFVCQQEVTHPRHISSGMIWSWGTIKHGWRWYRTPSGDFWCYFHSFMICQLHLWNIVHRYYTIMD